MEKSKQGTTAFQKDLGTTKTNNAANSSKMGKTAMGGSTMGSRSMKKQEKSSEEEIMEKEIQSVEIARLAKVFDQLRRAKELHSQKDQTQQKWESSTNQIKDNSTKENNSNPQLQKEGSAGQSADANDYFTAEDVMIILNDLDYTATKAEVEQMIWEVDENLDERVNSYEFGLMYRRCRHDTTGLEPRNLYNLVQFLMYLKNDTNVSSSGSSNAAASKTTSEQAHHKTTITIEDTLELLYVRYGRLNLDREIEEIFGKDEKNAQGEEKSITLQEYLDKQKKRDFVQRKELEAERKKVKIPENDKDN